MHIPQLPWPMIIKFPLLLFLFDLTPFSKEVTPLSPHWSIRRESCDAHTGWNWDPKWVRTWPHGVSLKHWDLLEVLPRCQKRLRNILKNGFWKIFNTGSVHLISIYRYMLEAPCKNFNSSERTWSKKQKLLWMQITGATNIRILGVAITFKRIGRRRETALWLHGNPAQCITVLNINYIILYYIILYYIILYYIILYYIILVYHIISYYYIILYYIILYYIILYYTWYIIY